MEVRLERQVTEFSRGLRAFSSGSSGSSEEASEEKAAERQRGEATKEGVRRTEASGRSEAITNSRRLWTEALYLIA